MGLENPNTCGTCSQWMPWRKTAMNGYCSMLEDINFTLSPQKLMDLHPFWQEQDDFLIQAKKLFATTHRMGGCSKHSPLEVDLTKGDNVCPEG